MNLSQVEIARLKVTPLNIPKIPSGFEVPFNFTILNLDIDLYDLYVFESILKNGYQPEIISMEVNEKIPPRIFFTMLYRADVLWEGDNFYGCSLQAANQMLIKYNYVLVKLEITMLYLLGTDTLVHLG